ncbi:unnamed protein product [Vicia faba]|uniref:Uncharacterized protein n=1 Tax=Vicia faba TaxID=3906 RepID=A0AAV0YI45_VICFA|nr:unnamed protein product [Vicia faba]
MGSARSCRGSFRKYWSRVHFHQSISSYHYRLPPLSPEEMLVAHVVASTSAHEAQIPAVVVASEACLSEGGEQEVLTPFFRLPTILQSLVPSTPEEFVAAMAYEDLNFIGGFSSTDRKSLFAYTSRTFFKVGSLVSIVFVGYDDVPSFGELSREWNDLRERYEAIEWENYDAEKERIKKLKASLADGEKHCKKVYKDAAEACLVFEADRKALHHRKDDRASSFKGLEEEEAFTRQKSRESLE